MTLNDAAKHDAPDPSGTATPPGISASGTGAGPDAEGSADAAITIYVCVTCRAGRPLDLVPIPGEAFAAATARAAAGTRMTVRPIRCLANCNRGLSAAVRREGAWTYVFGGLDEATGPAALVAGARLFAEAPDGLMPWRGRPEPLKRGLVARTPPFGFSHEPPDAGVVPSGGAVEPGGAA